MKSTRAKNNTRVAVINVVYSLVLAVATIVGLSLYAVKDPDLLVELSVGVVIGAVVASILGWIFKKSLFLTMLITTGVFVLAGLMILMQVDLSVF